MDKLHRHRPFTDSGSYTFYGAMSNVANCKNARNVGFEQEGIPVEQPSLGALPVANEIRASQQKTTFVPLDDASQPIRTWQCSNKDEHGARWHTFNLSSI